LVETSPNFKIFKGDARVTKALGGVALKFLVRTKVNAEYPEIC
jgi:hypothetical protein